MKQNKRKYRLTVVYQVAVAGPQLAAEDLDAVGTAVFALEGEVEDIPYREGLATAIKRRILHFFVGMLPLEFIVVSVLSIKAHKMYSLELDDGPESGYIGLTRKKKPHA